MAKLVTKFKYLKPDRGQNAGGYAKYIATREGVEKIDDTVKLSPATIKQKQFIEKILHDFPDTKEMLEYEDYVKDSTKGNASEFITRAMEDNAHEVMSTKTYADYIATRPRAEKFGTHGLFTDDGVQVKLNRVSAELNLHKGNVWTVIISLRREDAQRLGYNTGVRWRDMLRTQTEALAANLKIPMENLKWFAAFHNESHHPHVHLIAYSTIENEGYLTKQGVMNLRSAFAKDIFAQDLLCIYEKQSEHRNELRKQSREKLLEIVSEINAGIYDNPKLEGMLIELSDKLSHTSGKKVYGYLKADVKAMIDSIVDELAGDIRIAKLYELWYEQREEVMRTYTETVQERVPLSGNKEFKDIRNAVIKEAMNIVMNKKIYEDKNTFEEMEELEIQELRQEEKIEIIDADNEPIEINESMEENEQEKYDKQTESVKGFNSYRKKEKTWWTDEYRLARKYLYGTKDNLMDFIKAFELMRKEAEKGNGFAMYDMGKMMLSGFGCEKDEIQAQEWFAKAYNTFIIQETKIKNPGYIRYRIGKLYFLGYGVKQDYLKASEWYEKAMAEKNPFAAYALGGLYHIGQGVEQNEEKAFELFKMAADDKLKPNAYAQYELGNMCRAGVGTEVNIAESKKWFAKAYNGFVCIEQKMADDRLYYRLGQMNLSGTGTERDLNRAEIYFEKAAELDNKDAIYGLGKLYLNKEFEKYDVQKALGYLTKAANDGHDMAQYMIGKVYLYGNEVNRDYGKAVAYLTLSAGHGNEYAASLLQCIKNNRKKYAIAGTVRLFHYISRAIRNSLEEERGREIRIDRKLKRKINEKKQAHGLKQG